MDFLKRINQLLEQHPKSVAQLFNKSGISADPTHRNLANALKVKGIPLFRQLLATMHKKGLSAPGDAAGQAAAYDLVDGDNSNLTGPTNEELYRFGQTLADLNRQAILRKRFGQVAPTGFLALPPYNPALGYQTPTAYNPYGLPPYGYGYGQNYQAYQDNQPATVNADVGGSVTGSSKIWWIAGIVVVLYFIYRK